MNAPLNRKIGATVQGNAFVFPSNIVPQDKKEFEVWKKSWSDAIYNYSGLCFKDENERNYRAAKGVIREEDFEYITKLYADASHPDWIMPAKLMGVNSIARILNDIIGTADQEGFSFYAAVTNNQAITKKLDDLVEEQTQKLTRWVRQKAGVTEKLGAPVVEGDDLLPVKESDIESNNMLTYQQKKEKNISKALKYLIEDKKNYLAYKFIHQGLYSLLVSGKFAFRADVAFSNPVAYFIDSRSLVYELDSASPFIHKGRFAGHYFWMTPQEVKDKCPDMSSEDVKYVDEMQSNFVAGTIGANSSYWNVNKTLNCLYFNGMYQQWKGLKKRWCKIKVNKYDDKNPFVNFVSDNERKDFLEQVKKGKLNGDDITFEQREYTVKYECMRIGEKVYYDCRECPNQLVDGDFPQECELDIIGVVDDIPPVVSLMVPIEEMKLQCYYALQLLINQPSGKIMVVDEATEEDEPGNLYRMKIFKVYKINTRKEGEQQIPGATPMAPKEVDMTMSDAINQIMRLIQFLDMSLLSMVGLNPAFMGGVKSGQGAEVTQLSHQSAERALQPYYFTFYTTVEMILQRLCDLMPVAWGDEEIIRYWAGDEGADFFALSSDDRMDKYGVFIKNNVSGNAQKKMLFDLAAKLLPTQTEPDLIFSLVDMFSADSSAEAREILKKGVDTMKKIKDKADAQRDKELQLKEQEIGVLKQSKEAAVEGAQKTVLGKTQMEQEGETERTKLKIQHDEDKQIVKYKNDIAEAVATGILESEKKKHEKSLETAEK